MSKEIKDQWDVLVQIGSGDIHTSGSTAELKLSIVKLITNTARINFVFPLKIK